jgi:hypothetical protein
MRGRRFGFLGSLCKKMFFFARRRFRSGWRLFLVAMLVFFGFQFLDGGTCAIGARRIAAATKPQAQLLRDVLVDRAGVGLLLRDAQFRQ